MTCVDPRAVVVMEIELYVRLSLYATAIASKVDTSRRREDERAVLCL